MRLSGMRKKSFRAKGGNAQQAKELAAAAAATTKAEAGGGQQTQEEPDWQVVEVLECVLTAVEMAQIWQGWVGEAEVYGLTFQDFLEMCGMRIKINNC